ncbi:MAG: hypothetical protein V4611_04240 [Patescibacteria group bacterium]
MKTMNLDGLEKFSQNIPVYVELLANIIVIIGALPIFFWLRNRSFEKKKKEISDNLAIRKNIKDKLRDHADNYDRRTPHDIGIRLVHWKNYPWKLDDDGYKQNLYYDTNLDKRIDHGTEFLSNTGILVEDDIWVLSRSLYTGKFGTYIIAESGQKFEEFEEVNQKIKIVRTFKYKHIINWDFEEKIEYEPAFYTRYKYTDKKLFEKEFFAQNADDDGISKDLMYKEQFITSNRVKSAKSFKYKLLIINGERARKRQINKMKSQVKVTKKKRA